MTTGTIRGALHRVFRRGAGGRKAIDPRLLDALATRDQWFHSHFVYAAELVAKYLGRVVPLEEAKVLDFGCGDGIMSKGVARFTREVHGVDIAHNFWNVEDRFKQAFGSSPPHLPVQLRLVEAGKPLPYQNGAFDAAYAWSAFEHVDDVPYAMRELHRVVRPGGAFFLIIEPLYYSPHGAHLWGLLDEPWIHLRISREEVIERIRQVGSLEGKSECARLNLQEYESDAHYRETVINYCLPSLNEVTVRQLSEHIEAAGFTILEKELSQHCPYDIPPELLDRYPMEDLVTNQVILLMTR